MTTSDASVSSRERILSASLDYVLDHGLIGLSLRPLAAAIGTSDRMIIYHFHSKDGLIDAVVARANGLLTDTVAAIPAASPGLADITVFAWNYLATETGTKLAQLYVELCALAMRDPERWTQAHRTVRRSWTELLGSAGDVPGESDRVRTTERLVVGVLDGLLLDALTTGEREQARAALDRFLEML